MKKPSLHTKPLRKEETGIVLLNVLTAGALILLTVPLFMMSHYNIPSGDDWSYGYQVYHSIQNREGILSYFKSILHTVKLNYLVWEPRWANVLFASLCPANFGEKWAHLNTWIFVPSLIFSQIIFLKQLFRFEGLRFKYILPCVLSALAVEIMYAPYPTETFFWWTGSVNYTFAFSLALVYMTLLLILLRDEISVRKRYVLTVPASLLAAAAAAANFFIIVPMMIVNFLTAVRLIWQFARKRPRAAFSYFVSLCAPILCFIFSLCLVLSAPSLAVQTASRLNGTVSNGLFASIFLSAAAALRQIFTVWLDAKTVCLVLLYLPLLYIGVKDCHFKFPFPAAASVLSFGLFASMICVEIYTRDAVYSSYGYDIWFYSFYLLLLFNETYWIGWIAKRPRFSSLKKRLKTRIPAWCALVWCVCFGTAILLTAYCKDLKQLTGYQAYNYVNNGWSRQFSAEWEERFHILHDPAVKNPSFQKISVYGGYITVYDFYEENAVEYWINDAAARYYGKESIRIIP